MMHRMNIQLPSKLKSKLDAERKRGTSAAGLIGICGAVFQGQEGRVVHNQPGRDSKWRRKR